MESETGADRTPYLAQGKTLLQPHHHLGCKAFGARIPYFPSPLDICSPSPGPWAGDSLSDNSCLLVVGIVTVADYRLSSPMET